MSGFILIRAWYNYLGEELYSVVKWIEYRESNVSYQLIWSTFQILPRPQSFTYENGGKLIIKTNRGTGKDGKKRKFSFPSPSLALRTRSQAPHVHPESSWFLSPLSHVSRREPVKQAVSNECRKTKPKVITLTIITGQNIKWTNQKSKKIQEISI